MSRGRAAMVTELANPESARPRRGHAQGKNLFFWRGEVDDAFEVEEFVAGEVEGGLDAVGFDDVLFVEEADHACAFEGMGITGPVDGICFEFDALGAGDEDIGTELDVLVGIDHKEVTCLYLEAVALGMVAEDKGHVVHEDAAELGLAFKCELAGFDLEFAVGSGLAQLGICIGGYPLAVLLGGGLGCWLLGAGGRQKKGKYKGVTAHGVWSKLRYLG